MDTNPDLLGRHEGYYRSDVKQTIKLPVSDTLPNGECVELQEGELVNFEYSYKVSLIRLAVGALLTCEP